MDFRDGMPEDMVSKCVGYDYPRSAPYEADILHIFMIPTTLDQSLN